jgi:hypothetical protein
MDYLVDILKIVLPAGLVIYGMYLTILSFLKKEKDNIDHEISAQQTNSIIPIRLQAAERLCLLLERVSVNQLLLRVNSGGFSARELQLALLNDVREEFNHNLAQQIYFSEETWNSVKTAIENTLTLINTAGEKTSPDAKGLDLARMILQLAVDQNTDPIAIALRNVKSEIQTYF